MLARCARCQNTFTTERYGLQKCPHCGTELLLADPDAPPPQPPETPPPPPRAGSPAEAAGPRLEGSALPPPPAPPAGAWGGGGTPSPPGGSGPPPGGGGFGPPPGGPPPGGELPAPFAERRQRGFFGSYFETWKLAATTPQEFFRRVRVDQSGSAVLFGFLSFTVGQAVATLYQLVGSAQYDQMMQETLRNLPPEQAEVFEKLMHYLTGGATLWVVFTAPVVAIVSIYLSAAIFHLLLMLFRGASRGFDATLTTVGYAHGLYLLLAVPACGGLVALVWSMVVFIIGLAAAHRCGQGKAAAAVLSPLGLCCCCCGGAVAVGVASFVKAMSGAGGGSVEL